MSQKYKYLFLLSQKCAGLVLHLASEPRVTSAKTALWRHYGIHTLHPHQVTLIAFHSSSTSAHGSLLPYDLLYVPEIVIDVDELKNAIKLDWRAVQSMNEIHAAIMQFLPNLREVLKQDGGHSAHFWLSKNKILYFRDIFSVFVCLLKHFQEILSSFILGVLYINFQQKLTK